MKSALDQAVKSGKSKQELLIEERKKRFAVDEKQKPDEDKPEQGEGAKPDSSETAKHDVFSRLRKRDEKAQKKEEVNPIDCDLEQVIENERR